MSGVERALLGAIDLVEGERFEEARAELASIAQSLGAEAGSTAWLAVGALHAALRDEHEARAAFETAVERAISDEERLAALDALAELCERLGAYRAAVAAGERALAIASPSGRHARHDRLGDLLFSAQSPERALAHLREAIALEPGSTHLRMKAAARLARLGRDRETLVELREAMRLSPGVPLLLQRAGLLLASVGLVDVAESYLRAALAPVERVHAVLPGAPGDDEVRRELTAALRVEEPAGPPVVGPGQEEHVRRIVQPPSLPPGWAFERCQVTDRLTAHYRHADGTRARLVLGHPEAAGAPAKRTARFALALEASRRVPALPSLAAALEANVRAHEAGFVWKRAARDQPSPAETEVPREQVALGPAESAPVRAALAELRLWANDLDEAGALAEQALADDPRCAAAHRIRGAVRLFRGEPEAALAPLDEALRLDGRDAAACVLRAEARYRLGRLAEAAADVARGGEAAEDFSDYLAAQLVRLVLLAVEGRFPGLPDHCVPEALAVLCPGEAGRFDPADPKAIVAVLERALARLGGNRGASPTYLDGDRVTPLRLRPSPRGPAKAALFLIQAEGVEAALARFAEVHADYPRSPEPWCYEGELHLYLGDWQRARARFERALELYRGTRWAYIGLGATWLLEGDPHGALSVLREGVERAGGPGPTTFVYRGEAHRLLGEREAARADLEHATATTPLRVGAWIDLALLELDEARVEAAHAIVERLKGQAPALVAEAARATGLRPWEMTLVPDEARRLLEAMLSLLRGNRASACVTFVSLDGELRVVAPNPPPREEPVRALLASLRARLAHA